VKKEVHTTGSTRNRLIVGEITRNHGEQKGGRKEG
jgi:hypothetical protein